MNKKHFNIRIQGRVQGVFFRASARAHADALEITGFARNESDGSVYIEAEGEKENLEKFIEWCNRGPENAVVNNVKAKEATLQNFSSFEVNRGIH